MKKTNPVLWKCRAVESEENQTAVSLSFHSPWKSLRDSHIPAAPTIAAFSSKTQNQKGAQPDPPSPYPFRLILR